MNFTSVTGQTYSSLTTDKEIYDFLNWMTINDKKHRESPIFRRKQIYVEILSWDSSNFVLNEGNAGFYLFKSRGGTDTLFKQDDRDFLYNQFLAIKDSVWHSKFSNSKLLTNKEQKKPNRYYYSIPLFSVDKNMVIVRRTYYCGNLCAYGGYYVYRRLGNNKWEYVTAVNTWIS